MLQRLPVVFVQIKASNTSEKFSSQIRQILYSLHLSKEITKHRSNTNEY